MQELTRDAGLNRTAKETASDLELRGVRKAFGKIVAIDHLDLRLERGELVALLGPSGCGKTTTLRIVAGFEMPDSGEVWMRGRLATGLPVHRRDVGIVFQSYALFPHMTVFENVAYGLRRRRVQSDEIKRRVCDTLEMVHLDDLAERYPRELSGGQQQRVAVARAVVIRPSILLFDEPLSNLDAKLRQSMRGELRHLQRQLGITALFVTHDQDEALTMADRVAVMNAGIIEQIGTAQEIYRRPQTRFVATFVGECNFLDAQIIAIEGGCGHFNIGSVTARIALPGQIGRIGAAGTVALRPEDVRLLPADDHCDGDTNFLDGRVIEAVYFGSRYHYRIAIIGGPEVVVILQRDSSVPFEQGTPVKIAWNPADGVFYPSNP